jgi:hypothetical protein
MKKDFWQWFGGQYRMYRYHWRRDTGERLVPAQFNSLLVKFRQRYQKSHRPVILASLGVPLGVH